MKNIEIHLGYFKQGDDLNHCLESTNNNMDAFLMHAKLLSDCVNQLNKIADILKDFPEADTSVEAGTHFIAIEGPEEVLDALLEQKVACVSERDDEEERYEPQD